MKLQFSAAALAAAFISLACLQGCADHWVSQKEYFETSMSHDSRMASMNNTTYGYTPPPMDAWPDDHPLATPFHESEPLIIINDAAPTIGGNPVAYERSTFAFDTRQKLDAMQRDLDRVNAKAIQKGASVIAATDPKVRDFNSARRRINELLTNAAAASPSDWQDRTMRINYELDLARRAVNEASSLAETTPPTQNP